MPRRAPATESNACERLLALCEPEPNSGCWLWLGAMNQYGYGRMRFRSQKLALAHRVSFTLFRHEIPEDLDLDHVCRTRPCVNPWHVEPVTRALNTRRGEPATRRRCVNGHEYTPENTYRDARGRRDCRTCRRDRKRLAHRRLGAA